MDSKNFNRVLTNGIAYSQDSSRWKDRKIEELESVVKELSSAVFDLTVFLENPNTENSRNALENADRLLLKTKRDTGYSPSLYKSPPVE